MSTDKRIGKRVKFDRDVGTNQWSFSLDKLYNVFYHAKTAEGVSERTLETYRENYAFFCEYIDRESIARDIRNINAEVIRSYTSYLLYEKVKFDGHKHKSDKEKTVGLSPVTVNTRTKMLRVMFRFLFAEGKITKNPFDTVKPVEEHESEIKIMTVDQLKLLLSAPNQRSYAGFRDYVIMNVLIDGFFRIGEVMNIKKSDIDFDIGMLTVRAEVAKSRRSRMIPLQRHTLKLIGEIIAETEEFNSEYIFLTNYGEKLSANQFRHRLREYIEVANLDIRVYPHLFRHTAATLFLENGGDVRHLSMILGHADLRMVVKYTHLSKNSLKLQHDKFTPLNQVIGKLQRDRKIKR